MNRISILVVNCNTDPALTAAIDVSAKAAATPYTTVITAAPSWGVSSAESYLDSYISAVAVLDLLESWPDPVDAVVLAGFGEHGRDAARELLDVPVVDITDASAQVAMSLAPRYGVVTSLDRTVVQIEESLDNAGVRTACVGVRATGIPVLDLGDYARTSAAVVGVAAGLMAEGAEAIVLGCAGMAGLADELTWQLSMPVVDPVRAGVGVAEMLARLNLKTSKIKTYARPLDKPRMGWPTGFPNPSVHSDDSDVRATASPRGEEYCMEIDRDRLADLIGRECTRYRHIHPASAAVHDQAHHLLGRVPMTWMSKWSGGFPIVLERAKGNRVVDIDGNEYVDFALGDTGAMAGHSPEPTVHAIVHRVGELGGISAMLPTEDAEWVGAELTRRFGMPQWSFSLSATDANRWMLRIARLVTGRPRVLVFSYSYHGTVDESFIVLNEDGVARSRPGNVGPAVDPTTTTRVAAWNDLTSVERELANGDVAAILTEPALTNIGIVLPQPGFLDGLRELADKHGTLLIIDETHTISAGPGGMTRRDGLRPDAVVVGKAIGGGIPCGAYGITEEIAEQVRAAVSDGRADMVDVGGVGGTLAGNALSVAAMRVTLAEVLTDEAFTSMIAASRRYTDEVRRVIGAAELPWTIVQLGARAEYRFCDPAPVDGNQSAAAADDALDEYFHLYTANRGILMTPFHNMALMCSTTTVADVDRYTEVFAGAVAELVG